MRRGRIEKKEYWVDFSSLVIEAADIKEAEKMAMKEANKRGLDVSNVEEAY